MNPTTSSIGEIYVDTRDEVAVTRMLGCVAPAVTVSAVDRDARLGLARWRLPDVAATLAADPGPRTASCGFDDGPYVLADLDGLIAAVRSHAAQHYQRWYPVIDRNHDMQEIGTNPHVKIAAIDPQPAAAPSSPVR